MSFVKLDCGILDSSLWVDWDARELFITASLMAVPVEFPEGRKQLEVLTLKETGFEVPAGEYGLVEAARGWDYSEGRHGDGGGVGGAGLVGVAGTTEPVIGF